MPRLSIQCEAWQCGTSCRIALLLLSGLTFSVTPSLPAFAQDPPPGIPAPHDPFAPHIAEAAARFDLPEHWIVAVLNAESAGDRRAVSRAGAMGLMQIMPDTWAELRARYGLGPDPFAVRDNIHAGAAYLRELLDRYGNIGAMLAAYNAGPGRYDEYRASGRILPAETRAYVAALAPILGAESIPFSAAAVPPAPSDWRAAPLFVGPLDARFKASPAQDANPSGDGEDVHPADGHSPLSVEASGLFARRSGAGGPP